VGFRREGGNSVNGTSGNDRESVSVSAIGVANRREMVVITDWERVGCEREGENVRDIRVGLVGGQLSL
jgi:hypothetical protein